jgi:diguanylate cyclase (GGDEF)-like protein
MIWSPRQRLQLRALAAAACAALACVATPAAARAADLAQLVDSLVQEGDEAPRPAIASLEELARLGTATTPAQRRMVALSIGVVAARSGLEAQARSRIDALHAMADPLADADAHTVRAELEMNDGQIETAYQEAREALRGYSGACEAGPRARTDCDYRAWWRALDLAEAGASGQGNVVVASAYAQTMLDVARRAGDHAREALAIATGALLAEANGDPATANRQLAQAQRLAHLQGDPWLDVRVAITEGVLHRRRQQFEATARTYRDALAVAQAAQLDRLAAHLRMNLSDAYLQQDKPAPALAQIRLALPVVRSHGDQRKELTLLHNSALAQLALGHLAEGKAELAHVLELRERYAGLGRRATALHEFGEALEKAGDIAGAIDLFHKEEALEQQIRAANKAAAEAEMRGRFDREAQQRRIELLARDNQLKSAELENQSLTRNLWMFAGAALVLLGVLAVLMYLRMRELNRTLVRHEALLRAHSERDALTGLANRRQFREVMRVRGGERSFQGALLMVDVDHFKDINDHHGHAAGDRVLVEIARRLGAAVRGADLVARWGGEEFLVFAPGVDGRELDQLAERVRAAVCTKPIAIEGRAPLEVTVSVGYAAFPLPASHVPVSWEQAVNLADLSLYTAKNHGRNCAVGIVRTTAGTTAALREVEADLARAHQEGRVTLRVLPEAPARDAMSTA